MSKSKKSEPNALELIKQRIKNNEEKPDQIIELDLSEIPIKKFTPEIKNEIEKCKKVEVLLASECGLTSLENLPNKLNLVAVDFSNNSLPDAELQHLVKFTGLKQIILRTNQITDMQSFQVLTALKDLEEVDFAENPVTQKDGYSEFLFDIIPTLQIVDEKDRDGNDVPQEEELDDSGEDDGDDSEEDFDSDEDGQDYDDDDEEEESDKPKKKQHK